MKGKTFTVLLLSTDTTQYCYGKFTRRGKEPKATTEFVKAGSKFQDGTVWLVTKPTLSKEKPLYIGSSVKAVIDLNTSTVTPVLQSTAFANLVPTPAENLDTLLQAPSSQRVDITALVVKLSDVRSHVTACGPRLITDVTIRDASGPTGASECEFTLFFEDSQSGRTSLDEFRKCRADSTPVAFFNLCIHESTAGKKTLKPHRDNFRWTKATTGTRAADLVKQAQVLQSTDKATRVAEISQFVPNEAIDYVSCEATITVTRLLREIIRAQDEFPDSEQTHLFQLNNVRVIEPAAGEDILTGEERRLFVPVTLEDIHGQVHLRMREKAALDLSQLPDRNQFTEDTRNAELNFPILASVRVRVRKTSGNAANDTAEAGVAENAISAVIVEATEQTIENPKSMPNASMNFVIDLLKPLGIQGSDRMTIAPAKAVRHSPHGGLIVQDTDGTPHACASVLTLLAHVGRCSVVDLPAGHRIATSTTWNVPFGDNVKQDDGAPEHTDSMLDARFVSYCTMSNVQHFTLSSRKAKQPTYAMVILGSSHVSEGITNFMMNKVQLLTSDDIVAAQKLFTKLSLVSDMSGNAIAASPASHKREWTLDVSPFRAKRAKRLTSWPSADSIGTAKGS